MPDDGVLDRQGGQEAWTEKVCLLIHLNAHLGAYPH